MNPVSGPQISRYPTGDNQPEKEPQCKQAVEQSKRKFGDMFVKLHDVIPKGILKKANQVVKQETNRHFNRAVDGFPRSKLIGFDYEPLTDLESKLFRKLSLNTSDHFPPLYSIRLAETAITGLRLDDSCELMNKEFIVEKLRKNVQSDEVIDLLFSAIKKMAVESQLGGCTINIESASIERFPVTKELITDETKHFWCQHFKHHHKTNLFMSVTMNNKIKKNGCGYSGGDIITACKNKYGHELTPDENEIMEIHDIGEKNTAILQSGDDRLIFRTNNAHLIGHGDLAEKRVFFLYVTVDNDQENPS
ncbi:hypothetical protein [Endozoicomonas sp. YOMI1]|uniref:hypothetical protein n=1 Tax=Endozoicomonas sp. YOMI1 TaxID=2828739 RepID=UPI002148DD0D|nr:hypothetical protein [Endozoicomonas sp. YOMI1]